MYAGTYDGWFRGRADYGEYHHGPYGLLQPDGWGSGTVGFPACPALPVRCVFHRRGRVRFQENQTGRYLKASKEMPPAPCGRTAIFFGLFSSGGLSRLAVAVLLLSFLAIF